MDRIEQLFAVAIILVIAMGAFAIAYVVKRGLRVMSAAGERPADVVGRIEKQAALQKEGIELMRESIAVQRETNRLLAELLARGGLGGPKPAGDEAPAGEPR
jgi:hypothetical protein